MVTLNRHTAPMGGTGSGLSPDDVVRADALRRMKTLALSLLIVMAIIFAVSFALQERILWLQYVRAASEGGMVGALADWFAVTALFRHPLGVPIPHTAIIPTRKDAIGASLSGFVRDNFLSSEVVRAKLETIDVARKAGLVAAGVEPVMLPLLVLRPPKDAGNGA